MVPWIGLRGHSLSIGLTRAGRSARRTALGQIRRLGRRAPATAAPGRTGRFPPGRPGYRSFGWNGDLATRPLRAQAIAGLGRQPIKAAIRSGADPTAQRSDRVSAAAWRAWVHAAPTRSRVVMLMRSGRCDCATLRGAVGRALAVAADWHGGGAGQSIRLAGIREGVAASERYGGDERGG